MRSGKLVAGAIGCAVMLGLAGCESLPGYGEAEAVSLMATKKTLTDNVVSYYSGKDCSTLRKEQGLAYCKEDQVIPKANVYCYQTLGSVTCYDRPDPYDPRRRELGDNSQNYTPKK